MPFTPAYPTPVESGPSPTQPKEGAVESEYQITELASSVEPEPAFQVTESTTPEVDEVTATATADLPSQTVLFDATATVNSI